MRQKTPETYEEKEAQLKELRHEAVHAGSEAAVEKQHAKGKKTAVPLTSDEIDKHPLRNVITKAVGAKDSIEIDVVEHPLAPGDVIMLCSDGLHAMMNDEAILGVVTPFPDTLEQAAAQLIDAANDAGGKDNVTVVLVRYTE